MVSSVLVEHGWDLSGTEAQRPATSDLGVRFLNTTKGKIETFDGTRWLSSVQIAIATYDFAVDGGAISTITPSKGYNLPDNAIILDGMVDVITTLTSAGDLATIAIQTEAANDIVTAVAIGTGTPWDAGLRAIIPLGTNTTAIKLTAARDIKIVIAVEALTAGKFHTILRYITTD